MEKIQCNYTNLESLEEVRIMEYFKDTKFYPFQKQISPIKSNLSTDPAKYTWLEILKLCT